MVRNLLSNALKYTRRGKVLLGCRRRGGSLAIEVWDTGDRHTGRGTESDLRGVSPTRQRRARAQAAASASASPSCVVWRICSATRSTSVRSLARGRSLPSKCLSLPDEVAAPPEGDRAERPLKKAIRTGAILVVEDDPEVRELLDHLLKDEGHRVVTAPDGIAALDSVGARNRSARPYPRGLQSAARHERTAGRRKAARKVWQPDSGHHSDRRYLDPHACAKSLGSIACSSTSR